MKVAVIGSGWMGSAFVTALATRTSHAVSVRGSHAKSSSTAALIRELGVSRADDKASLSAVVVVVAVPPSALAEVASDLKNYKGVVVSVIVPGAAGMALLCRRVVGVAWQEKAPHALDRSEPVGRDLLR
jgi:predicted dinucleotide-binding enzyme